MFWRRLKQPGENWAGRTTLTWLLRCPKGINEAWDNLENIEDARRENKSTLKNKKESK